MLNFIFNNRHYNQMYLIHDAVRKSVNKLLKDGYMKPYLITKNVEMYGYPQGSKYIFLKLQYGNDI